MKQEMSHNDLVCEDPPSEHPPVHLQRPGSFAYEQLPYYGGSGTDEQQLRANIKFVIHLQYKRTHLGRTMTTCWVSE